MHPNSRKNLEAGKWPKGFTPNPNGRPPAGWTWAEIIRAYGNTECPPEFSAKLGLGENPKWKEVVVAQAFRHAAFGNASILRTLVEYIDGRPAIEINHHVAEKLKQEAADAGIDWTEIPGLAEIIAVADAIENGPGNNQKVGKA